jgi:hypothetical protein
MAQSNDVLTDDEEVSLPSSKGTGRDVLSIASKSHLESSLAKQ